ncbi:DHH family protein [Staphylococcus gallinarum]|uniref:DHH family protein n=1 Tax=Staphylococcus gallinarum TaxID=1293 RepID=A0A380FBX9_STAGA|nr:DHH family protein [Staphylococcus gallinarum]
MIWGGKMNRQSTKKALILPFIILALTAIALVVVWFIFNQLVAGIATVVLVFVIIATAWMVRQAFRKLDYYVNNLSGHISAGNNIAIKTFTYRYDYLR